MKLQITLDILDLDEALEYLDKISPYADIVEVGTPLSLMYGIKAVQKIKEKYPELLVLDDIKLCDGGRRSSWACLSKGADMITILGISDKSTIRAGIEEAEKQGKQAVIDMIHVENLPEKIRQADELGAQVIGVHVGIDSQAHGENPLEALRIARENVSHAQVSVAGGLKDDSYLDSILKYKPDILVVGNGIRKADDPVTAAKRIRERIKAAEQQIMV
ncbi:3-hexulose-6-phosphate synthase [Lachnospiraceae bacterium 62-35]